MDIENNHDNIRITVAIIVASVGVAFMSRLPQLLPGQQVISWYQSGFFWAGIAIVVMALLILIVPSKNWKRVWWSITGLPRWLRELYIWHKYGPKCTLEIPAIDYELYSDSNERRYSTKVHLSINVSEKANNYYPIRCDLSDIKFTLYQKQGLMPVSASLERNPLLATKILRNTSGNTSHWIGLSWFPYNNQDIVFLDVNRRYKWEITDVYIYLGNLHKRRKLTKTGWAVNVKRD